MTVKVYAMTCGWVTMPMNSLLEGEEGTLLVPVPSYLIDHPKGTVLFDTGLHSAIFTDKAGYLGKMAKWLDVTFHPACDAEICSAGWSWCAASPGAPPARERSTLARLSSSGAL